MRNADVLFVARICNNYEVLCHMPVSSKTFIIIITYEKQKDRIFLSVGLSHVT
jgi:hypothetical protein